jgi:hypothetical protein
MIETLVVAGYQVLRDLVLPMARLHDRAPMPNPDRSCRQSRSLPSRALVAQELFPFLR